MVGYSGMIPSYWWKPRLYLSYTAQDAGFFRLFYVSSSQQRASLYILCQCNVGLTSLLVNVHNRISLKRYAFLDIEISYPSPQLKITQVTSVEEEHRAPRIMLD